MAKTEAKVLITGSTGMLGTALHKGLSDKYEIIGWSRSNCDIAEREETIDKIAQVAPDIIIHVAAYTDVDGCELDSKKAHQVNGLGTQNIALASQRTKSLLIYISTDYVFDGEKKRPYLESDPPNPINVYGQTKLEGERFIQSLLKRYLIVRSSWLFGPGKKNFVEVMLERAKKEKVISIVNDKFSSSTYTLDLAKAIDILLSTDFYGIYHITNSNFCSWFEYARKILEYAKINDVELRPISLKQLNRPARRPRMSILDGSRYQRLTNYYLRPWQEALKEYLNSASDTKRMLI